jgi:23S rRNA (pseudouridine1915-N3)-methyltransferase
MLPITLICIGSLKTKWVKEGAEQYLLRIGPRLKIQELSASKQQDPKRQQAEENTKILEAMENARGVTWVLDETGKTYTSQAFAAELGKLQDRGEPLTLVLGGAYGLTSEVRAKAQRVVRLSDMTFPHELCRLVLLEQLYRAQEIRKGTGYHH